MTIAGKQKCTAPKDSHRERKPPLIPTLAAVPNDGPPRDDLLTIIVVIGRFQSSEPQPAVGASLKYNTAMGLRCCLFALMLLVACTKNPYTGRLQLDLIPASQEQAMGIQAFDQLMHDPKVTVSHDPREVQPVQRVARRIIEAAKTSKYAETAKLFQWEVTTIKDARTMNAFALPGGKIAVYTGIFPVAKDEAGLRGKLLRDLSRRYGAGR